MGLQGAPQEYRQGRFLFYIGIAMGLWANYMIPDAFHEYVAFDGLRLDSSPTIQSIASLEA